MMPYGSTHPYPDSGRTPGSSPRGALRLPSAPSALAVLGLSVLALVAACGSDSTGPDGLRFGQIGEVRLRLESPRGQLGEGLLEQVVVWSSEGPYRLEETISYEGVEGDRTEARQVTNPSLLAGLYAEWIAQVNERPAQSLFVDELDPDLDPDCGPTRTRISLTIRDDVRDEQVTWRRCVAGSLGKLSLRTADPLPDPAAARVVQAAIIMRDLTLGEGFVSNYDGSVPFATVARGEDTDVGFTHPETIITAEGWQRFWEDHLADEGEAPVIDFGKDIVIVGAVGVRREAGDSVEVRRVVTVDEETLVVLFERVPGNFCSPVERTQTPYHVVRAPRAVLLLPVTFAEVRVELVPCGI